MTKLKQTVFLLFRQLRPKQWTKNLLVFAALMFSMKIATLDMAYQTVACFFLFSFVSGCVYILNDYMDREADRNHPEKRHRPMASGALNPALAIAFGALLLAGCLIAAFAMNKMLFAVLAGYFAMNVAYSTKLKHVAVLDLMIISAGFVFRAIAGGLAINVNITPWFFLCTMLLSLFLATSKRRGELSLLQENKGSHRKVLERYSLPLLDQLNTICVGGAIIAYSLFTFSSGHTKILMATIPFVVYGIFRYLQLVHIEGKGGSPDKVLLEDKPILATVALYAASVAGILLMFDK